MSKRLNPVAIIFTGVILCGLCWIGGKHSADRYYANNPKVVYVTETYDAQTGKLIKYCESLTGHPCGKDKIELTDPPAPAGIGKPQAPAPVENKIKSDGPKWPEGPLRMPVVAHPLKRPKTWPPDCKPPSCAPVSTEPIHWADGTCTDFFTQETIPCPLKLGKRSRKDAPNVSWEPGDGPAAKTYTYAYHDCEDTQPHGDYPGTIDWTTCFDRSTQKVRYQQRILTAPIKSKLGKRKPAPKQGGCTPEMGPGCAFIANASWNFTNEMAQYMAQCFVHGFTVQEANDHFFASNGIDTLPNGETYFILTDVKPPSWWDKLRGVPTSQVPQP